MLNYSGSGKVMDAELKGYLLIGARPFPNRYGELNGLKIHEVGRQIVMSKGLCGRSLVEVGLSGKRD